MKGFFIILSLLITVKLFAAQKAAYSDSAAINTQRLFTRIDNLNNTAYRIYLNSPDSARRLAEAALLLSEKNNYLLGKGRSYYNIGLIYWSQSYYTISLFYLNSALNNLPKHSNLYLSDCFNALGRTYADLGNYNRALINLNKSLGLAGNDIGRLAEVFSEKSYVYCALKNYPQAIADALHALALHSGIKATGDIAILNARLAGIYKSKGDLKKALYYDNIALKMSRVIGNKRLRAKIYVEYAIINNSLNKYNEAINYAQKGIALADSIGLIDAQKDGFKSLVRSFEAKNDLKQALAYQKRYSSLNDSISNASKLKTAKLIENYHDLSAKISGIKLMEVSDRENKAKIKAQTNLIIFLSASLVVLIALLFVTWYLYKQKKLLSTKLEQQHKALLDQKVLIEAQTVNLQSVNGLKDKLLAVIGHDLRTPVANMSNIIELFNDEYLSATEISDLMREIRPIIKGAELTLSNLTEWAGSQIKGKNVNSINIDVFLLGVEMEQTFTHHLQQKNIEFINSAFPGQSVLADENHIKVILRNLISNAIKFTNNSGRITLSTAMEDNSIIVSVTDTGKGMSPEEVEKLFSLNTHFSNSGTSGERGTGIGLLLCKELVELNGGKLSVSSAISKGSTFYFNLPLVGAYA
ncbi:ATP-binding protein [Mucilaginibacter sp. L3T2-6]|uniref:tetratricopeptide repeat-containing sensor histidine kinase n=1 Tax=Mucilaginibacter sp. L3T2-6 TaxID=3062491 RepID=UPI0026760F59|nr:ATP-binding protein [Mucilaginibacter sp. L3T2-6]MDO3644140.1 ATP-binding protein [Mucilaginibacter sp. L3T2-6]MDV6216579.1 ATP-binding protein [Mucilaginibacter sp. L3T2-6]